MQDQITIRKLDDNPGIIPIKLGNAKIKEFTHSLIHYFDLNPIIIEINKLNIKSRNITKTVGAHYEYANDVSNYIKILKITQDRVENKLNDIIPHSLRVKRGLVNGFGTLFKSVTGNLDASDGERYESLIRELQENQKGLQASILKQNSLSITVINRFNFTLSQINNNENLLETKINQISLFVQKTAYRENSLLIKDLINQIINLYEIINSILQDVENSLTFSKLKIIHPSIIKTKDLYFELKKIEQQIGAEHMPMNVTLENTLTFEKLLSLESFVLNNKIIHILNIPIMYSPNFEYFHLYSVPIYRQGRFKVILPRSKYLLKNKLHYAYLEEGCHKTLPNLYTCEREQPKDVQEDNPCIVKLLNSERNTSTCEQTEVKISQVLIDRLENTNQWILVLPKKEIVELRCHNQKEVLNIMGTYLCEVPIGCHLITKSELIFNDHNQINSNKKPILFPDFSNSPSILPVLKLDSHIQKLKLDMLHNLRKEFSENGPHLTFGKITTMPSLWTIIIYGFLIASCVYLGSKKIIEKTTSYFKAKDIKEPAEIQLPCLP